MSQGFRGVQGHFCPRCAGAITPAELCPEGQARVALADMEQRQREELEHWKRRAFMAECENNDRSLARAVERDRLKAAGEGLVRALLGMTAIPNLTLSSRELDAIRCWREVAGPDGPAESDVALKAMCETGRRRGYKTSAWVEKLRNED